MDWLNPFSNKHSKLQNPLIHLENGCKDSIHTISIFTVPSADLYCINVVRFCTTIAGIITNGECYCGFRFSDYSLTDNMLPTNLTILFNVTNLRSLLAFNRDSLFNNDLVFGYKLLFRERCQLERTSLSIKICNIFGKRVSNFLTLEYAKQIGCNK